MSTSPLMSGAVGVVDSPRPYSDVARVIDDRAIRTVFQPIVRLDTCEVIGYEALSRGPAGTRWQDPHAMFAAARAIGRAGELDWICRAQAHRGAVAAGLSPEAVLFVNVEPSTLREPCPPDLLPAFVRIHDRVIMEFTERDVAADPAALLAATAAHRAAGHGVALDDVGAEPGSLALMPFVQPDVVKLDMRLLHNPDAPHTTRVVDAVTAHAGRTGALILAEGIERESHLALARASGATLGQGWLLGRPTPLSPARAYGAGPAPVRPLRLPPPVDGPAPASGPVRTPFEIVVGNRPTARASEQALLTITRYLESAAADAVDPPVLLTCFQDAVRFTPATAHRYTALANGSPFVAAFGAGFAPGQVPGVRGAALAADDPLRDEWNVIVVGPYFSAALVARDLGGSGADRHRRFEYALTYDRPRVLAAARTLLGRLEPLPT